MATHNETGKFGESLAVDFLKKSGFQILQRNWRYKRAEIDIIAKDDEVLVFIEVKTRTSTNFGEPAEFVTSRKEQLIIDAAAAFMESINHEWEIRFDVIGVVLQQGSPPDIRHHRDAFFPGLQYYPSNS